MAICKNCEESVADLRKVFTLSERILILTSACQMMKWLMEANVPGQDRVVCDSVITKSLLTFEPAMREALIEQYKKSARFGISIGSCPHNSAPALVTS